MSSATLIRRPFSWARAARRQALIAAVEAYPVLPMDMEAADAAAQIAVVLDKAGRPLPPQDIMIAGIAAAHGFELVTRNARHFSRIEGLRLRLC